MPWFCMDQMRFRDYRISGFFGIDICPSESFDHVTDKRIATNGYQWIFPREIDYSFVRFSVKLMECNFYFVDNDLCFFLPGGYFPNLIYHL